MRPFELGQAVVAMVAASRLVTASEVSRRRWLNATYRIAATRRGINAASRFRRMGVSGYSREARGVNREMYVSEKEIESIDDNDRELDAIVVVTEEQRKAATRAAYIALTAEMKRFREYLIYQKDEIDYPVGVETSEVVADHVDRCNAERERILAELQAARAIESDSRDRLAAPL